MGNLGGDKLVKQTFYNLSPDKKQRIIDAIIKEVDGKSFEDISINQIVKNAEISRGSFYQYFNDKQDIFYVLMHGFTDNPNQVCEKSLEKNNGDLLSAGMDIFDFILEISKEKNYFVVFKTVFSCVGVNNAFIPSGVKKCKDLTLLNVITEKVNYSLLNGEEDADIENMVTIICSVIIRSCFDIFVLDMAEQVVKEHLHKMFLLMKNGFYRR